MKLRQHLYLAILVVTIFSCNEELEDEDSYTRILDDQTYENAYEPIAIAETFDGGAIVLAAVASDPESYPRVSVLKVDELGNWERINTLPDPYVSPASGMGRLDSTFYFFCMDENNYRTYMVSVNQQGDILNQVPAGGSPTFPLASFADSLSNELLLLSYDAENKRSVVTRHAPDANQTGGAAYTIGEGSDADPLVLAHFAQRRSRLPFSIGRAANGSYYFNGLFNFSFSLVFTSFGDNPTGVIQGQGTSGGISAILPLNTGNYAAAGYQFEQNFIRPDVPLTETGISSSIDLLDRDQAELRSNSRIKMTTYTLDQQNFMVCAGETESREIVLYVYDAEGQLIDSKYIGNINSFNLGDIVVTADNSLLVLGSTFVAGRFERLFVQKISEIQMKDLIN